MANSTFTGPVRSKSGFNHVSINSTTGVETESEIVNSSGDLVAPVISAAPVNLTAATLTLSAATHGGRVVTVNKADGTAITLPDPSGSGTVFKLFIGTTITSNSTTIKVAAATDTMSGVAVVANDTDNSASIFETAADTDTITLDGSTTGGILGQMITLTDVADNKWHVHSSGAATGTEATPFSATVS